MQVESIELVRVRIPFKVAFRHALSDRRRSDAVVVIARSTTGETGLGEILPREYLTGETVAASLSALWEGLLGVPKVGDYRSEKENVDEDILVLGRGAMHVELDLMQPIDPAKAPKVHVPTLNHIGIWVHPLDKAVAHLEAQGVRFTPGGIRKGAAGHDVCFIHPKGNEASPRGGASLPLGWMKHTSWPEAPLRMPPGVKRTPWPSSQATAAARSSTHRPT